MKVTIKYCPLSQSTSFCMRNTRLCLFKYLAYKSKSKSEGEGEGARGGVLIPLALNLCFYSTRFSQTDERVTSKQVDAYLIRLGNIGI